jgi:hypothetical protein
MIEHESKDCFAPLAKTGCMERSVIKAVHGLKTLPLRSARKDRLHGAISHQGCTWIESIAASLRSQ